MSTIFRLTYARFVARISSARLEWSRIVSRLLCMSLLPVLVVVVLRTICAVVLYLSLSPTTAINSTFEDALYIFAAWDSGHYASIARYWYPPYPSREWSFFPLYPTLIRILGVFGMDVPIGGLLVAAVCGLASILVFQKLANFYLPRERSLQASLVYFLLPPVFVFSAVYYSEPVFLLFSLLSWYFCINGNSWKSCVAASLTTLVRSYGVLIVVPLGFQYLRRRQYWQLAYCLVPVLTLVGWMLYSLIVTGILAPLYSQGTFLTERSGYYTLIEETIRESLQGNAVSAVSKLLEYAYVNLHLLIPSLVSLMLVAVLAIRVANIDRALGVYTIVSIGAILYFGLPASLISFPRYFAFIFPIGLALNTRKTKTLLSGLILLALLDYLAWYAFLTGDFY